MTQVIYHDAYKPITFNPNDNTDAPWATYITARNGPNFKVHATRGHALNALSRICHGVLYEWVEGASEWREVLRRERGAYPDECADCLTRFAPDDFYGRDGEWIIVRDRSRKPVEPLEQRYVCSPCKRAAA